MTNEVEVLLEAEATEDELAAVAGIFAEAHIDAHVEVDPLCKGAGGEFPWMIAISVPVGGFLTAFAAKAGEDAYEKFKTLIKRLYNTRKASKFRSGRVVLIDIESGKSAVLPPEVSHDVWRRMPELDLGEYAPAVFRWDPDTGDWQEIRYE